jgi:hypothetical protein
MENIKQKLEIADIFRKFGDGYSDIHNLHPVQTKAFNDIINCRSDEMGGHIEKCDHCGHTKHAYNSCRNRHCPKCQYIKQVQWVDKLKSKLPPTRHFHLVFTIPQSLHKLFYLNQAQAYKLLFKASAMALKTCAANPKFLGAQTGAVAVLHTWGQTLNYHPHIHMIVPAGGLSEDDMEWVHSGKTFFLPVKVLSALFRGILCSLLEKATINSTLKLPDDCSSFNKIKSQLYKNSWNVYAKKPFGSVDKVVEYLGKYTHRVAISNHRIMSYSDGRITFRCKDHKTGMFTKQITLDAHEFIRRFMQHILPCGFYKIRYFGIMALCAGQEKNSLCFELIGKESFLPALEGLPAFDVFREVIGKNPYHCPACKKGKMRPVSLLVPKQIKSG